MDTSVEAALTRVQGLLRKGHTESEQTVVWLAPPGRKDERALGLSRQEDDALSDLEWSLNQDPRFDHLKGKPHDVAVGFFSLAPRVDPHSGPAVRPSQWKAPLRGRRLLVRVRRLPNPRQCARFFSRTRQKS